MTPTADLDAILSRDPAAITAAMDDLARATAMRELGEGGDAAIREAELRVAKVLGQTTALADLLGRRRLLLDLRRARSHFAAKPEPDQDAVPRVPFHEAIRSLAERHPEFVKPVNGVPLWQAVSEQYRRGAFVLAHGIAEKVQEKIGAALRSGFTVESGVKSIQPFIDGTRAYAENVFRTTAATAFNEGRFEQASDPDVADVVAGMEYVAVGDADTRENHAAADGLRARIDHPIWDVMRPPLGYMCRCDTRIITVFEAKEAGWLDANGRLIYHEPANFGAAGPDPGFVK